GHERRLRQTAGPGDHRVGRRSPVRPRPGGRRGRREHGALHRGAHPRCRPPPLARRPPGPGGARRHRQGGVRAAARRARGRQRHDGDPVRRQEQLVRRLRVLVPQAVRARGRPDHGRWQAEVDRRGAGADDRRPDARADDVHGAGARRVAARAPRGRAAHRRDGRRASRRRAFPAGVLGRTDRHARLRAGGRAARRAHPGRQVDPVGQGGAGGRHVQAGRGAARPLRRTGGRHLEADDGVLPHRRALQPHLVRAPRAARLGRRPELRRLLDGVGQPRRRPDREGRL
ncbi:MAG: Thiosulfate sulfurtransferase, rhodanese, partial [uncultured Thermoleophilia bacterium]